ncbi:MAG: aroK [Chlamydiales bacterium]|jgi:shikimate kinase|nr:aroK [Chlamydiales bacterium]
MKSNSISLIGYRAVGKSTIGALLAKKLNLPVLCSDSLIEEYVQMNIAQFVQQKGWPIFREIEKLILRKIVDQTLQSPYVIISGGGVVIDSENRDLLRSCSLVYWLQADVLTIQKRLDLNCERRPPLQSNCAVNEVEEVLKQRTPLYQITCNQIINTASYSVEESVYAIIQHYRAQNIVSSFNQEIISKG